MREFGEARFESAGRVSGPALAGGAAALFHCLLARRRTRGRCICALPWCAIETHGRAKKGLASGFFADHSDMFVKNIPVYVQESRTFRLPKDGATDIIMCGPGVGVAPFRAFLEQRALDGATGRNWLFFGEQHRATDFLYGDELLEYQRKGKLHRLDLAFSRDQSHKIYVQHRMLEQAKELWSWLQNGAYFYVCGDARHMAKDVHQALIDIAQKEGGLSRRRRGGVRERHADEDREAVSAGCVLSRANLPARLIPLSSAPGIPARAARRRRRRCCICRSG